MPPKPTPTNVLAARGSWRAKERAGEPTPPSTPTLPPTKLTGEARAIYDRLAPSLHACGLLTSADLPRFKDYCRLSVAWDKAMTEVEETGSRSAILSLAKVDEMLRKLAASFGLTPADRTNIRVDVPTENDKSRFFAA